MANEFLRVESAKDLIVEAENKILAGADIAYMDSVKESYRVFKEELPNFYNSFYTYVRGGKNGLGSVTFTQEDFDRVYLPLIPAKHNMIYNIVEHLYCYELVTDKEVKKRTLDLFKFLQGFEEIVKGLYIKLHKRTVYLVNTNTGKIYKKKYKDYVGSKPKRLYIDRKVFRVDLEYNCGHKELVVENSRKQLDTWTLADTTLEKGYKRLEVDGMYFRQHLVIVGLVYGLQVAKFLVGRNSLLTIHHVDEVESNNSINNLQILTRESNRKISDGVEHAGYNFIELFERVMVGDKNYYVL